MPAAVTSTVQVEGSNIGSSASEPEWTLQVRHERARRLSPHQTKNKVYSDVVIKGENWSLNIELSGCGLYRDLCRQ